MNFRYGKDLPSVGWEYTPIAMPEDKPAGKISKITYCPLAATWKKLPDGCRLGPILLLDRPDEVQALWQRLPLLP